jgi:hypothetical protein
MSGKHERHNASKSKWEWGGEPARSDQVRAAAEADAASESSQPQELRKRSRKDTRHWCRGKAGREHEVIVTLPTSGWRKLSPCQWRSHGHWVTYGHLGPGAPVPRQSWRKNGPLRREWELTDRYYCCYHQRQCENCGKVLGRVEPADCPDWKEDPGNDESGLEQRRGT